jgi:hypothetical protein
MLLESLGPVNVEIVCLHMQLHKMLWLKGLYQEYPVPEAGDKFRMRLPVICTLRNIDLIFSIV